MRFLYMGVFLWLLGGAVWAQGGEGGGGTERDMLRQQRRSELRHALQAPYLSAEPRDGPYQLSIQERQALRLQLRQQHQGPGRIPPE